MKFYNGFPPNSLKLKDYLIFGVLLSTCIAIHIITLFDFREEA